jgi:hypothetical protein
MRHCQNNLEACTTRTTELGIESLDMSAEYVEFLKRGRREYKALEAIVKGWKVKATDASGTDASIKVRLLDFLLALLLRGGARFSAWLSACLSPRPPPPPRCMPCISRNLKCKGAVRNHNSVGMKRPYLHELSFDHSHYGVA